MTREGKVVRMKEFICVLKQTDKVTRQNIWSMVISLLFGTGVGWIGSLIFYYGAGFWCGMEVPMAMGTMATIFILGGFVMFPRDFMQALTMGKTRKYLFPAHYVLWMRNTLIGMLGILGICYIKDSVYSNFTEGSVLIRDEWAILSNPLIFMTIVLCVPALILFLGAMRLFLGIKMFWGFLGLFMFGIGFAEWKERHPDFTVLRWLITGNGEPNVVVICLLCWLCGVMMFGLAWLVLRRQRVVC